MTQSEPGYVQLFAADLGKPLQWRLLSGNNRESGRGVGSYPDEPSVRAAVAEFQRGLDALRPAVRRKSNHQWGWQLLRGDEPVATSGRDYDRMVRCEQALHAFVRVIRTAPISETVLVSSSRRWELR